MSTPSLPSLSECRTSPPALLTLLEYLFNPSPPLTSLLLPSLSSSLTAAEPTSYSEIIDGCERIMSSWTWAEKAEFLSGHPMIGEVKGVKGPSGHEQGGATRPVVLARLKHLNEMYCTIYPGLRYMTFVAGRPRSAIVSEMEALVDLPVSPDPLPDDLDAERPALDGEWVQGRIKPLESEAWRTECERGLGETFKIARDRLGKAGVQ